MEDDPVVLDPVVPVVDPLSEPAVVPLPELAVVPLPEPAVVPEDAVDALVPMLVLALVPMLVLSEPDPTASLPSVSPSPGSCPAHPKIPTATPTKTQQTLRAEKGRP